MPVQKDPPSPPGRLVEIGNGRALHAVFSRPDLVGTVLVVLEAGSFGFSADWAAVQYRLAQAGVRSMAYDRAGLGFSRPGPEPRDGQAIAEDLEALLAALDEYGPLILCGHSMAGLHVRLFTCRNMSRVRGAVLVDATTPESISINSVKRLIAQYGQISSLWAWGAGRGLLRGLAGTALGDMIGHEGRSGEEKRWAFAHPAHNHWASREVLSWPDTAWQAQEAGQYDRRMPVAVILPGEQGPLTGQRGLRAAPARVANHGRIDFVPGANHATMLSRAHADAIVNGILFVKSKAGL